MKIRYRKNGRQYVEDVPLKEYLRKLAKRFRDWVTDKQDKSEQTQTIRDRHGVYIEKSVGRTVRRETIAKRVCITVLAVALVIVAVRMLVDVIVIALALAVLALLFATFFK